MDMEWVGQPNWLAGHLRRPCRRCGSARAAPEIARARPRAVPRMSRCAAHVALGLACAHCLRYSRVHRAVPAPGMLPLCPRLGCTRAPRAVSTMERRPFGPPLQSNLSVVFEWETFPTQSSAPLLSQKLEISYFLLSFPLCLSSSRGCLLFSSGKLSLLNLAPLFSKEIEMGDHESIKNPSAKENSLNDQSEGAKKTHMASKIDDVISTIIDDSFISFRKKFHFPNDLVMKVPARSDRACFPPLGYVMVYKFSLRAGLQFLLAPELINILTICSGRISFRSKWLDIHTRDPSKYWISDFFFVQNDWGLQEKWGKLKELPIPHHIGAEYLLRILKLPYIDALHCEMRCLSRYIDEECLFKVGLSTQAGRSHAQILKKSVKVLETQKGQSKRSEVEGDLQSPKKKRSDEVLIVASKGPCFSPSKIYIPEDVLKHKCIDRRRTDELGYISHLLIYLEQQLEANKALDDWNDEFMKVKYLQGEYKKRYEGKAKEMRMMDDQLEQCKTELANRIASNTSQNERMDRLHIQLVETEEARDHFYDVEVKALEAELIEDGFNKGFMKGVHAAQHKNEGEIEGLTPSQASGDPSPNFDGEELESEMQQIFALKEDENDIEIL
ncbi:hypothetical protein KFK09_001559 [Dendrobium nobile]|uniref:Uncharacterized protein n=1 Tax=Dendrobium nobile TaxID=94219 RepID=A0A8T3C8H9_DENNO|nr:hypothetical protein KFK09_001559 [Dendrobium nobile]